MSANSLKDALTLLRHDFHEYGRDLIHLLQKKHELVYAHRTGALPPAPDNTKVALVAIWPEITNLLSTQNLMRGLAENGFYILVVSTKRVEGALAEGLLPHCHHLIERFPVGRDFGSFKLGLEWLWRQSFFAEVEYLALVNDSMYYAANVGAIVREMFEEGRDAPWIGMFGSYNPCFHVQSFFQIFKAPVFRSETFVNFWKNYIPFTPHSWGSPMGENRISRLLMDAKFFPYIFYNTLKVYRAVIQRMREKNAEEDRLFRYVLFLSLKFIPRNWRDGLSINDPADLAKMEALDIGHKASILMEYQNPTHGAGLLCNHLFGAPIKRDLSYKGTHAITDVVELSQGFSAEERAAMYLNFERRGTGAAFQHGVGRLLRMKGRV